MVVPKFLLEDGHLSTHAKLLLTLLDDYRNKVTGQCNPRVRRLAANLRLGERTIYRALAELRKWQLVTIQRCRYVCQYIIAARDQWLKLLCKKFSTAEEIPAPKVQETLVPDQEKAASGTDARPANQAGQSCQLGRSGAPVSLLTEPTYGTYLSTNGGAVPPRSVHHAEEKQAPATPALVVDNSSGEDQAALFARPNRPLRSPLSEPLWRDLVSAHPQPGKALSALEEIDKLLHENWTQATKLAKTLRTRHDQWREYWATLEKGAFIPQLWRWVKEGEWIVAPVIRTPARRAFESKAERLDRIFRDMDQRDRKAGRE
ncbi:MAG TPA: helix-turn-helix domain-containing protein [Terracidiphilus sp.]